MSIFDEAARLGIFGDAPTPSSEPTPAAAPPKQSPRTPATSGSVQPEPTPATSEPTEEQELATPDETETVAASDETDPARPALDRFALRRKAALGAALVVALALVWFLAKPDTTTPELLTSDGGSGTALAATPDAESVLRTDLRRASEQLSTTGSLKGFAPTAPVVAASGEEVLVLVLATGEGCFYTGIAPGFDGAVKSDPTGQHCAPEELTAIQSELDANDAATTELDTTAADARLANAVDVAQFWGSSHVQDEAADLSPLVGEQLVDGVRATGVSDGGQSLEISTELGAGSCRVLELSLLGEGSPRTQRC